MSTIGNGTVGNFTIGPTSGYKLELYHLFIVFCLFLYRLSANTNNHYHVIILLKNNMIYFMAFGIKINRKMSKILTIYTTY
jgi:hypothetical protein